MLENEESAAIRSFGNVIAWAAFLAFDLIILGSLVRATDSGLACPDWPLCYNQLAPAMDMQIFLEWFHRLSALILGGVLIGAIVKVIKQPLIRKYFGTQLYFSGLLFLSQCILGGLTVLKLLDPTIVSLHLINALVFFALLLWSTIKAKMLVRNQFELKVPESAKYIFFVFSFLVLAQIFLGGMVSSNHAGLVCPDFPKCHDQWLPEGSFLFYLQVYHRFIAYFIFAFSIVLNIIYFRPNPKPLFTHIVRIIPTLVLLQILLGVINVFYALPVWASVAHLANALVLFTLSFSTSVVLWSAESFKNKPKTIEASRSATVSLTTS